MRKLFGSSAATVSVGLGLTGAGTRPRVGLPAITPATIWPWVKPPEDWLSHAE